MLIPDLLISDDPAAEGLYLRADQVVLVAEIVHAQAQVPYCLVVEEFDAVLHEWHDGEYHLAAKSEGGVLHLRRPFPPVLALGG